MMTNSDNCNQFNSQTNLAVGQWQTEDLWPVGKVVDISVLIESPAVSQRVSAVNQDDKLHIENIDNELPDSGVECIDLNEEQIGSDADTELYYEGDYQDMIYKDTRNEQQKQNYFLSIGLISTSQVSEKATCATEYKPTLQTSLTSHQEKGTHGSGYDNKAVIEKIDLTSPFGQRLCDLIGNPKLKLTDTQKNVDVRVLRCSWKPLSKNMNSSYLTDQFPITFRQKRQKSKLQNFCHEYKRYNNKMRKCQVKINKCCNDSFRKLFLLNTGSEVYGFTPLQPADQELSAGNVELLNPVDNNSSLVESPIHGGLATCFCFGRTGANVQTNILHGERLNDLDIYFLAAHDIFTLLNSRYKLWKLSVTVNFIEVDNKQVFDLLNNRISMDIFRGKNKIEVIGVTEQPVSSVYDVKTILYNGNLIRDSKVTSDSERYSHTVFQFIFRERESMRLHGKFTIVNLAGSMSEIGEALSSTRPMNMDAEETDVNICAVKNCLAAAGCRNARIPYDDSMLTLILHDAFNIDKSKKCMLAEVTPSSCELYTLGTERHKQRIPLNGPLDKTRCIEDGPVTHCSSVDGHSGCNDGSTHVDQHDTSQLDQQFEAQREKKIREQQEIQSKEALARELWCTNIESRANKPARKKCEMIYGHMMAERERRLQEYQEQYLRNIAEEDQIEKSATDNSLDGEQHEAMEREQYEAREKFCEHIAAKIVDEHDYTEELEQMRLELAPEEQQEKDRQNNLVEPEKRRQMLISVERECRVADATIKTDTCEATYSSGRVTEHPERVSLSCAQKSRKWNPSWKRALYICQYCNKRFEHPSFLKRHAVVHTGIKLFTCTICDKSFALKHGLQLHVRRHGEFKPFSCDDCGKKFTVKDDLMQHKTVHSEERRYLCKHCAKSFRQRQALYAHQQRHSTEKHFRCHLCCRQFSTKADLRRHTKLIHRADGKFAAGKQHLRSLTYHVKRVKTHRIEQYTATPSESSSKDRTSVGMAPVSESLELKFTARNMPMGKYVFVDGLIPVGVVPNPAYTCEYCDAIFAVASALREHSLMHEVQSNFGLQCDECLTRFGDSARLLDHMLAHTEENHRVHVILSTELMKMLTCFVQL